MQNPVIRALQLDHCLPPIQVFSGALESSESLGSWGGGSDVLVRGGYLQNMTAAVREKPRCQPIQAPNPPIASTTLPPLLITIRSNWTVR